MKIEHFAVLGHPISHTMSPFIHNQLFSLSNYFPKYDILDIENLDENIDLLKKYDGLNVTIPHKKNIIHLLSQIDDQAKRYYSVNTVKIENSFMSGFTTDGAGATEAIKSAGGNLGGKTLILGNGGAARAIAFEFEKYSKEITIAGRDIKKAQSLAQELKQAKSLSLEMLEENNENYDLMINATSVGMYPHQNACPVTSAVISRCDTVFDAVYNPGTTQLLQKASELDKLTVHGMDMLVYQAVVAHKIWYNAEFKREDIIKLIGDAKIACEEKFKGK